MKTGLGLTLALAAGLAAAQSSGVITPAFASQVLILDTTRHSVSDFGSVSVCLPPNLVNSVEKTCKTKEGANAWQDMLGMKVMLYELAGYEFKYRVNDRMLYLYLRKQK